MLKRLMLAQQSLFFMLKLELTAKNSGSQWQRNATKAKEIEKMSLTRAMLNGMGLSAEQISAIIDAHTETTDALKAQRDEFKAQAESLKDADKELKALKATAEDAESWKAKFEKEHSDFETYKTAESEKETKAAKSNAYKALLKEAGISEKRIDSVLRVADLTSIELDKDGKIKGADKLTENIKTEWSDFITTTVTEGAKTITPPSTQGGSAPDYENMSMADYVAARKAK